MTHSDTLIDVWAHNLYESVSKLQDMAERAAYIFIDAEFPGVVASVEGGFVDLIDMDYQDKRENSNLMHPIQYGFAFFDENKRRIEGPCAIQFNFKWDKDKDTCSYKSLKFLEDKGFDFSKLATDGIDYTEFAEAIIGSGLICNHKVSYIGFQCDYDIIYLLKLCSGLTRLPMNHDDLGQIMKVYFPCVYDFRYVTLRFHFFMGLSTIGAKFDVPHVGGSHHAGNDALFTGDVYFRFLEVYENYDINEFRNCVYGVTHVGYRGKDYVKPQF
nr:ccr4 not transcription complex subunit [Hymenolepis microstoma]